MASKFIIFAVLAALAQDPATATEDQNSPISLYDEIKADENDTLVKGRMGTKHVFDTIKAVDGLVKNGTQNQIPDFAEAQETTEYTYFKNHIDGYLSSLEKVQPGAAKLICQIRAAAYSGLEYAVEALRKAALLVKNKNPTEVKYAVEQYEKECGVGVERVIDNCYKPVLNGRDECSPVGSKIVSTKNQAIVAMKKAIAIMFKAVRLLLTRSCPDLHYPDLTGSEAYDDLKAEGVIYYTTDNTCVYSALYIILKENHSHSK